MPTRTVLFDLDDTLMFEGRTNVESFQAVCHNAQQRCGVDAERLQQAISHESEQLWRAGPMFEFCDGLGIASWEGLWGEFTNDEPSLAAVSPWIESFRLESWARALTACGLNDAAVAAELAEEFRCDRRLRHQPFDGAHELLTALKQQYRLGMITNGVSDIQWTKIKSLDFADYFDVILISGELGFGKPQARIFELALDKLQTSPDDTVMIGNSRARDIQGAHNAAIRAILINSADPEPANANITPDAEISHLRELPPLL